MKRINCLLMCTAVLGLIGPGSAYADPDPDKLQCPGARFCPVRDRNGDILPDQCAIQDFNDKKGDHWKFSCTNKGPGGNFLWEYDEQKESGKPVKKIGKCDRPQGNNTWRWLIDETNNNQVIGFEQECRSSKGVAPNKAPGNERTIRKFDKRTNTGKEFKESFAKPNGPWTEIPGTRREYTSLDLPYTNLDSPTVTEEALFAAGLHLVATGAGTNVVNVRWSAYQGAAYPHPSPVLRPNIDYVYLNIPITDLQDQDQRFTPSEKAPGVKLTPIVPVSLNTGDVLATINTHGAPSVYYATSVDGAVADFEAVFNGAPNERELQDTPTYAATAGILDMVLGCCVKPKGTQEHDVSQTYCNLLGGTWTEGPTCIPTLSEWGVAVMAMLVLTAGTIVVMRRRAAVA